MIHDSRNLIQHRGVNISQQEAGSCIGMTYRFMKRFLRDELNLNIQELLDARYYRLFEDIHLLEIHDIIQFIDTLDEKITLHNPIWIVQAYAVLAGDLALGKPFIPHSEPIIPKMVIESLVSSGKISQTELTKFEDLRILRDKYILSTGSINRVNVEEYLKFALFLSQKLKEIRRNDPIKYG